MEINFESSSVNESQRAPRGARRDHDATQTRCRGHLNLLISAKMAGLMRGYESYPEKFSCFIRDSGRPISFSMDFIESTIGFGPHV